MAYRGFLLKVGDYIVPNNVLITKGYSAKINTEDEDSYRDNMRDLHRNVVSTVPKIKITLMPMNNNEFDVIMDNFRANYTIAKERKANVTAWIGELGAYVTQEMYLADFEPTIININGNVLEYDSVTLSFTSYVGDIING